METKSGSGVNGELKVGESQNMGCIKEKENQISTWRIGKKFDVSIIGNNDCHMQHVTHRIIAENNRSWAKKRGLRKYDNYCSSKTQEVVFFVLLRTVSALGWCTGRKTDSLDRVQRSSKWSKIQKVYPVREGSVSWHSLP